MICVILMFKGSTEKAGGEAIMFELVLVGYSVKLQLHRELQIT